MELLKLLGYPLGTIVMYWGFLFIVTAPWVILILLIALGNAVCNAITGKTEEPMWITAWMDQLVQWLDRLQLERFAWVLGVCIQVWYAGYAAHTVPTLTRQGTQLAAIATHGIAILGLVVAMIMFYLIYTYVVEVKLPWWQYGLVSSSSLLAYGMLLQLPQVAGHLSSSWERVFAVLVMVFLDSM